MVTILKLVGSGLGLLAVWLLWPEFVLFLISASEAEARRPLKVSIR